MVEELTKKGGSRGGTGENAGLCRDSVLIVGADTMVSIDGKKLGKPAGEAGAEAMLKELSSRTHQVYTGVTLIRIKKESGHFSQESRTFSEGTDSLLLSDDGAGDL